MAVPMMISKASRFSLEIGGVLLYDGCYVFPLSSRTFNPKQQISTEICAFLRPVLNKNTSVLVSNPSEATLDIQTPAEKVRYLDPQNIPETPSQRYLDV